MLNRILVIALLAATALTTFVQAGPLEDTLLAGATVRLDVKGVELALQRGAKAGQKLPHPDAPSVVRPPIQFALSALVGADEKETPRKVERILRLLFNAGAKLTGEQDELFAVIAGGHDRILALLFEQGANPHARVYGYTLAELAIKYDHSKLLPLVYARGVPKVAAEEAAQIQFVQAASDQDLFAMETALKNGAVVNAVDAAGHVAVVQVFAMPLRNARAYVAAHWLILDMEADVNAIEHSDDSSTALHNVIKRSPNKKEDVQETAEFVEILLRKGANVSSVDSMGRTPLHYAAKTGNILAMDVLIRNGAKVMVRDALGKSPLDLAKSGQAISMLRMAGARE